MPHHFSIDLIICTYNNAPLLRQTLEALEKLDVPPELWWSVVVVNNNCTDDTTEVVKEFLQRGAIPLSMVVEKEQGLTPARRCGVLQSKADWVAFVDDDCLLAPDWLRQAERFVHDHPNCGLFGGKINLQWLHEPPAYAHHFPFAYAAKNHGGTAKRVRSVAGAGMVVRRQALMDCGWLASPLLPDRVGNRLVSGGDVEIALRVGTLYEVWYNPTCVLQHCIPPRRTTKPYLQRMLFGLGVSRHHVTALEWRYGYFRWVLFSLLYAVGMLGLCLSGLFQRHKRAAGITVLLASFFGWCAGIRLLSQMPNDQRQRLLGAAAAKQKPKPVVSVITNQHRPSESINR